MIAQHPESVDESLPAMLAARARRSSDTRLAADVGAGVVVALSMAVWRRGPWFVVVAAGLTLAAYGAWGIVDRELRERVAVGSASRALVVARGAAAAIGALGAAGAIFGLLGVALGTWTL